MSHHSTAGVEMRAKNYVLSRNKSWRILTIMKKVSVHFYRRYAMLDLYREKRACPSKTHLPND